MMRLDHNRAIAQLAKKLDVPITEISRMTVWGNHSATQYPDLYHAEVAARCGGAGRGDLAARRVHPDGRQARRGDHRGARGVVGGLGRERGDRPRPRLGVGTPEGDWTSAAIVSDGSYGVEEGLISSFPVVSKNRRWEIVQGLEIDAFSRGKIDASVAELAEEREAVKGLGLI
jgi:malate dehydrogenase